VAKAKNITATQVLELVERQDYRCAISGRKLTPETASLDHIVPFSRGGEHNISNVWVVDHQVNIAKGTMTLEEFMAMCRDVINHQDGKAAAQGNGDDQAEQAGQGEMVPPPGMLF